MEHSYDRVAAQYDATRGWPADVAEEIGRRLYGLLAEAAGKAPRVLEVGAGTGRALAPLAEAGAWAVGLDISAGMLARLGEKRASSKIGALYPVLGDAHRLPFRDRAFDAGLLVHLLHLVGDWRGVMDEVCRVVTPVGPILLGLDEHAPSEITWIEARWRDCVTEAGYDLPPNQRQAATREAVSYLEAHGYSAREEVLARRAVVETPTVHLNRLRERCFSSSWDIPDSVLLPALARLTSEMEVRYGSLDTPFVREHWFTLMVCHQTI